MDGPTGYDDDIYAWSQEQAAALRRLAETRRDLPNELDLDNIVDEIETVGRTEVRTVESFIELLLRHLLKLTSAPDALAARHWRNEIELQQQAVRDDLKNSMRQLIRLDKVWTAARKRADADLDQHGGAICPGLPKHCPLGLDDLLAEPFDIDLAVERIRVASQPRT